MKITKSLLVAALAFTSFANAQEASKFSLSGEFRPRTEWFGHGQSSTAANGSEGYVATSVRAALKATYTTESYTLFTSFQEVFRFGDRTQISAANNGNFRVQEAWADIKLADPLTLKIGRQPISYDNQRILGGLGWAQQARTHDAAIFKYSNEGYNLDLGFALNTTTSSQYPVATLFSYRDMAYVHASKKYGNTLISALILNNTYQVGTENKSNLTTAGLYFSTKVGPIALNGNGYIQDGYRANDTTVDMAYLAGLDASMNATEKLSFGLGGEIISGKTDDSAAFFPVYGTNHAFNGFMDRFYVGNHANAGGLLDIHVSATAKLPGGYALTGKFLNFSEVEDNNLDGEKALGNELDLVLAKKFNGFKVVGGYSQFFEPDTVLGAKDTQNWAWLMLIISPKFL